MVSSVMGVMGVVLVLLVFRVGWLKAELRRLLALERTLDKLNFCETARKHCMGRELERASDAVCWTGYCAKCF